MAARRELVLAVMGYMACSSTMLVVNKKAVHAIGAPATVLMLQMLASAGAVKGPPVCSSQDLLSPRQLRAPRQGSGHVLPFRSILAARHMCCCPLPSIPGLGMAAVVPVDALERKKAAKYFVASLGFLLALYANMKTLQVCPLPSPAGILHPAACRHPCQFGGHMLSIFCLLLSVYYIAFAPPIPCSGPHTHSLHRAPRWPRWVCPLSATCECCTLPCRACECHARRPGSTATWRRSSSSGRAPRW